MEISAPSNFEHRVHTGFDQQEQKFTGLPRQWQSLIEESARRPKPLIDPACITSIQPGAPKVQRHPLLPSLTQGPAPLPTSPHHGPVLAFPTPHPRPCSPRPEALIGPHTSRPRAPSAVILPPVPVTQLPAFPELPWQWGDRPAPRQ